MNALVESHVRYDYELIRTEEPGRCWPNGG